LTVDLLLGKVTVNAPSLSGSTEFFLIFNSSRTIVASNNFPVCGSGTETTYSGPKDVFLKDLQLYYNANKGKDIIEEFTMEMPDPYADIQAACNAFETVNVIDTALVGKATAARVKAIQRMSLKIIYEQIKYVHDCIFDENNEDEN
jgi:hypothetical protein